jgi:hypothetical protein
MSFVQVVRQKHGWLRAHFRYFDMGAIDSIARMH